MNDIFIIGEKLQLIEIIQLTLLLFIVISAIIFLISYLGYRRNSNTEPASDIKETVLKEVELENKIDDLKADKKQLNDEKQIVSKTPRFEVFTPVPNDDPMNKKEKLNKSKFHNPRTLLLKK